MHYLTPGPSEIFPRTRELISEALCKDIPSVSHRSKEFSVIYSRCAVALRALLSMPDDFQVLFLGSATEAMERIIQNCSLARTHHFTNGAFSERFLEIAKELGRKTTETRVESGKGFNLSDAIIPEDAELVTLTQNETSTGVWIPAKDISHLRRRAPHAVIAIDIVSSAPIPRIEWQGIDCAFFSIQKCFGLPAGLGVLLVRAELIDKATKLQKGGHSVGSFHSFPSLYASAKKLQTPATPNVLAIYLLAGISEYLIEQGIEHIRTESEGKAKLLYQTLSSHPNFSPFVTNPLWQSETVVTAVAREGFSAAFKRLHAAGFEVGAGYGDFKDNHIRIANFPSHSRELMEKLISVL